MTDEDQLTQLLVAWGDGDPNALEQLTPLVYERLRQLAQSAYRNEHGAQTLQPTAVVNEAWLQLANAQLELQSRHHFYALAARMMRRILVNHAVARKAAKRGGGQVMLTLNEGQYSAEQESEEVLALNEALENLAERDADLEALLELHYFGGYTTMEIAEAMNVSESTAKRQLRFARAWVRRALER
ncbi:MAG: ECF-type sigma factor [Xanthomonadales bacterium]|jgi:RNA polymerase sigma factor (TIGR02999 family)|nr:ECF-type sigma factor [Xanthomonadales bacterium]